MAKIQDRNAAIATHFVLDDDLHERIDVHDPRSDSRNVQGLSPHPVFRLQEFKVPRDIRSKILVRVHVDD